MDTAQLYEESLKQLENLKYFLRIMNYKAEGDLITVATDAVKQAIEESKNRPPQFLK